MTPEATAPDATRRVLCSSCDIYCQVLVDVADGAVRRVKAVDPRPLRANICMKGVHAPSGFAQASRIRQPLRRRGERGAGEWEAVSWDTALDEIAERLQTVVRRDGPEALAVSCSPWNVQTDNGMARRFMNLLGSPNWISGVALCAGNTAAVNRLVYGWFPYPDYPQTQCIVLFGHNPKPHSWTPVYNAIRRAQERGAKLIVLDPRKSESAERADLWLPLRVGTDAAMCLGWLHVIVREGLFDKTFVAQWTVGFEALAERLRAFTPERVAEITGVAPTLIEQAARLYATSGPAVIPWTPITDQQRNSTNAIRLHAILRAVCGNLDVPGGEVLHGFHPQIVSESALELHAVLPAGKKALQLGAQTHPVCTYRGMQALNEPARRVWGIEYPNLVSGSYMANPSAVFRAMADGDPYPVRAFFALGNNTLMGFANMPLIERALRAQELVVAFDHLKTPTAQLADFILPADAWTERPALADGFGWTAIARGSQQAVPKPAGCRSAYDLWKGLAVRMGLGEHFPWADETALLDHRVSALAPSFNQFAQEHAYHAGAMAYRKYERTGFATPSGKVELASSVLADLGFDALPGWREAPAADPAFPLQLFVGIREDEFFQTGHRHIPALRSRAPQPLAFLNPADAREHGINDGDIIGIHTRLGHCTMSCALREDMPPGLVRVPHGWWAPEQAEGDGGLSGARQWADAQLCPDDDAHLDNEQGVPHLKGIACRVVRQECSS